MSRERKDRGIPDPVRQITPNLPPQVRVLINAFIDTHQALSPRAMAEKLRCLHEAWQNEGWSLNLRAVALVLADLLEQGWWVTPVGDTIELQPPGTLLEGETVEKAKARLREAFRVGRAYQLSQPSTVAFLKRMHRPVRRMGRMTSVIDVVDDGKGLVPALRRCLLMSSDGAAEALSDIVRPVVQLCDDRARCEHSGLRLLDIWRYFRHTWSSEYRSIPGRQMPLLIRNAARPNHPVIGIALLASPVVRTNPRDKWIGWLPQEFIKRLREQEGCEAKPMLEALRARLERSLGEIRTDDLDLTERNLEAPTFQTVVRIQARAGGAARARHRMSTDEDDLDLLSRSQSEPDPDRDGADNVDWSAFSQSKLFVYKRADTLWRLLAAKRVFQSLNWSKQGPDLLRELLGHPEGNKALDIALREIRKAGLSSQISDLSVCGAVAPYNLLLGGKLVTVLMASREVRELYRERYRAQVSIISSQMAGRPIYRTAELKVLTTTSLYGNGSSQYNRLRLRAEQYPELGQDIEWQKLEKTLGYGTYHLGGQTLGVLRQISERRYGTRRINNLFGEGASPRLRQTREALAVLGIESRLILHHDTPRLFYGCELHPGAIEEMLGLSGRTNTKGPSIEAITSAWRRRWLVARIRQPDILERLAQLGPNTINADMLVPEEDGQLPLAFGVG